MALPNSEKITSQIAMLPDQALKQMAMMHKNDPYVLPLIISEDGRRKQMRQAAQAQMGGMPQPKVADAAVAQMGQLPEEQGIGVLPAPNMQSMADGGIAGYGGGGGLLTDDLMELRVKGALPRMEALKGVVDEHQVNFMATICAICKAQFTKVLPYYGFNMGMVGGVHQLVSKAIRLGDK